MQGLTGRPVLTPGAALAGIAACPRARAAATVAAFPE
jgi:hypothetical protein